MGQVHEAAIATDPKFGLVDVANATDELLPGGDELTPTMKLTRRPIFNKYAATIDGLHD